MRETSPRAAASPKAVMESHHAPRADTVSPPISAMPNFVCARERPAVKRRAQSAVGASVSASVRVYASGRAAFAARSDTFTASALYATSAGSSSSKK